MRAIKIFLSGVAALIAVLFLSVNPRLVALVFCVAIVLLVAAGFVIPVPRWFPFYGRALEEEAEPGEKLRANPFPNAVVFQSEIRNLWLLIVSPLYGLGLATVVLGHFDERWANTSGLNYIPFFFSLKVGKWITSAAVCFAWWWFQERWLLRKAGVGVGFGHTRLDDHEITYEYFDRDGERRGGSAFPFGEVTVSFPVFIHENDPDFSKPGFGFLFHRFAEIDAKCVPSSVLDRAQRLLAAQVASDSGH